MIPKRKKTLMDWSSSTVDAWESTRVVVAGCAGLHCEVLKTHDLVEEKKEKVG